MVATAQTTKRILIIEDEEGTRSMLCLLLELEGYSVISAANGREALDRLGGAAPPHLILLDLAMPVMDAWEFRKCQQQDPALASVPLILFSGDDHLRRSAAALGAAGFLSKPIDIAKLLLTIRRYC